MRAIGHDTVAIFDVVICCLYRHPMRHYAKNFSPMDSKGSCDVPLPIPVRRRSSHWS